MPIVPETISLFEFGFLISLSLFTSMLTAAIGIGGGSLLLAAMAQIVPIKALVPVHAVVQFGSNVGRAAVMRSSINFSLAAAFTFGSFVGCISGQPSCSKFID